MLSSFKSVPTVEMLTKETRSRRANTRASWLRGSKNWVECLLCSRVVKHKEWALRQHFTVIHDSHVTVDTYFDVFVVDSSGRPRWDAFLPQLAPQPKEEIEAEEEECPSRTRAPLQYTAIPSNGGEVGLAAINGWTRTLIPC